MRKKHNQPGGSMQQWPWLASGGLLPCQENNKYNQPGNHNLHASRCKKNQPATVAVLFLEKNLHLAMAMVVRGGACCLAAKTKIKIQPGGCGVW